MSPPGSPSPGASARPRARTLHRECMLPPVRDLRSVHDRSPVEGRHRHGSEPRHRAGHRGGAGDRGDRVCITGRNAEPLAEAAAGWARSGDLRGGSGARHRPPGRVAKTLEAFGRVDYLVNNVGTNPVFGPVLDLDADVIRKILDINVVSAFAWTSGVHRRGWASMAVRSSTSPPWRRCGPRRVGHIRREQGRAGLPDPAARRGTRAGHAGQRGGSRRDEDEVRPTPCTRDASPRSRPPTRPVASVCRGRGLGGRFPALRRGELDHRAHDGAGRRQHVGRFTRLTCRLGNRRREFWGGQ